MGGFLNIEGTAIHSDTHETALIGVLQLAQGHPDDIIGAFGHNSHTVWIHQILLLCFMKCTSFHVFACFMNKCFRDIPVKPNLLLPHCLTVIIPMIQLVLGIRISINGFIISSECLKSNKAKRLMLHQKKIKK
jgi:hypothetical protein